jgi:serine/threonine protein kinase
MEEEIRLGKYQIVKELGRGGFGIVYEAHDTILGRDVALKVLHSQHAVDRGFIERFGQEARMAAQLEHPHLVPVYDFNEINGRYIIVMGLMKGGSLKDQIKQYGAFDTFRAKKVLEQILEGIHYIHQNDVVHRDLKPSNILFDQHGTARISDLGFAKALRGSVDSSMSVSGGLVGTPAYMAPEVWHGKKATEQSDIYSLGCITYEMLTGEALFYGETPAESMTKHLIVGPQMDADLPKPWRELIEKCLDKEPEKRYSSAGAMLEDLKWGLFDALEARETEIVLGSSVDLDEAIAHGSPQPEEDALEGPMDNAVSTVGGNEDAPAEAYDVKSSMESVSSNYLQRAQPVGVLDSQPASKKLTPGQILELSPFKRLQMKLPWLIPLIFGVIVTLLAVVLVIILRTNNVGQFIKKVTEPPTFTYTVQLSNTKLPTNTPTQTDTPNKELTPTQITTSIDNSLALPEPTEIQINPEIYATNRTVINVQNMDRIAQIALLQGKMSSVGSTSFSPDSNFLVSASNDGSVRIWDTNSGIEIRRLTGHKDGVSSLSYSPDGKYIASASYDGTLRLWTSDEGVEVYKLDTGYQYPRSVFFTPDSQIVSCVAGGDILLWNVKTGEVIRKIESDKDSIISHNISHDGSLIASASWSGLIQIWDLKSGELLLDIHGPNSAIGSVHFSPDNSLLATAYDDHKIRIWNVNSGKEIVTLNEFMNKARGVRFSPSGELLVGVSQDSSVRIWEVGSWENTLLIGQHGKGVWNVNFSVDGTMIASAGSDGVIRIWGIP